MTSTTPPPRDPDTGNSSPAPPTDAAAVPGTPGAAGTPGVPGASGASSASGTDGTTGAQAPASAAPKYLRASRRSMVAMVFVATAGIALILWAWRVGPFQGSVVSTDNAYVRGQVTALSPQVSGYVAEVLVGDFAHVKAGQPLVRIDDRILVERVHQAEAQLENARAQLANAGQAEAQHLAQVDAARAALASARAESARAGADARRYEQLAGDRLVALSDRDRLRTAAQVANANVLRAQADIRIAEESVHSTRVSREGLAAQVRMAEAQLDLARIDLDNAVVRAPRDGQVGEASVRVGQYVTAGSQLMFLVPETLWVVANFKESQTWKMRIGQPATFSVDAFQGETLAGHVEEIAPATGSEFSVLRPDNASGNFTKVVQRLPVRIAVDPGQPLAARLRPGMSVVVRVETAGEGAAEPPPTR
jgi:multidrug resistance efflux pump